jgi:hypothetical protein
MTTGNLVVTVDGLPEGSTGFRLRHLVEARAFFIFARSVFCGHDAACNRIRTC